jgi:hypothetical protein
MNVENIKKQIDEDILNNNGDDFIKLFNYCMRVYRKIHKENVKIYNKNNKSKYKNRRLI